MITNEKYLCKKGDINERKDIAKKCFMGRWETICKPKKTAKMRKTFTERGEGQRIVHYQCNILPT